MTAPTDTETLIERARELGDMLVRQYGFAPDGAVVTLTAALADSLAAVAAERDRYEAALRDIAGLPYDRDGLQMHRAARAALGGLVTAGRPYLASAVIKPCTRCGGDTVLKVCSKCEPQKRRVVTPFDMRAAARRAGEPDPFPPPPAPEPVVEEPRRQRAASKQARRRAAPTRARKRVEGKPLPAPPPIPGSCPTCGGMKVAWGGGVAACKNNHRWSP